MEGGFGVVFGVVLGKTTPKTTRKPPPLTSPINSMIYALDMDAMISSAVIRDNIERRLAGLNTMILLSELDYN